MDIVIFFYKHEQTLLRISSWPHRRAWKNAAYIQRCPGQRKIRCFRTPSGGAPTPPPCLKDKWNSRSRVSTKNHDAGYASMPALNQTCSRYTQRTSGEYTGSSATSRPRNEDTSNPCLSRSRLQRRRPGLGLAVLCGNRSPSTG